MINPAEEYAFTIGDRVRVKPVWRDTFSGTPGTIVEMDAYTYTVRFDTITEAMKEFEDSRQGLGTFYGSDIEKI